MSIKKRYIIIGLILYIAVWGGNIACYQAHRLKEPLFLKQYYNFLNHDNFRIFYAMNKGETGKTVEISFPELPGFYVRSTESEQYTSNNFCTVNTVNISFDQKLFEQASGGRDVVLTKAHILFNNGKEMDADIGEIHLSPGEKVGKALKSWKSYSSSDGSGGVEYTVEEPITIKGVDDRLLKKFPDIVEIDINGEPLRGMSFPIKMDEGDSVSLQYRYSFKDKNDIRQYNYYALNPYIIYETEDRREWLGFLDVHHDVYLGSFNLKRLEGGNN